MKNPELRFKNDIDDWQEKELQDIATINKGKPIPKTTDAVTFSEYKRQTCIHSVIIRPPPSPP